MALDGYIIKWNLNIPLLYFSTSMRDNNTRHSRILFFLNSWRRSIVNVSFLLLAAFSLCLRQPTSPRYFKPINWPMQWTNTDKWLYVCLQALFNICSIAEREIWYKNVTFDAVKSRAKQSAAFNVTNLCHNT